jgi:tetratricopeptide (TPR) repeat protein
LQEIIGMLRFGIFTHALLLISAGLASDDLALVSRAVSDYERVNLAPRPELKDAIACVQSQAALLPITKPEQQHLVHSRKGVCELVAGRLRSSDKEYRDAVADLQQVISKWPAVSPSGGETVSAGIRVVLAIARFHGSGEEPDLENAARNFEALVARPHCPGTLVMSISECERYVNLGRVWLGWIRLRQGRMAESEAVLQKAPMTLWHQRVAGLNAFDRGRYPEAVWRFERAYAAAPQTGIIGLLTPEADRPRMHYEFALARAFAGEPAKALDAVNEAVKGDPKNAQALFLRARLRELAGQSRDAQADYELASRTAFANVERPFESGYAHYYRGVSLFRRKNFERAENEFSSALNFEIAEIAKTDVQAWRSMAAVAGGACDAAASELRAKLPQASPLFPAREAEEFLAQCAPRAITENRH